MPDPSNALPFDLRSLDVFLAVCDAGGMGAAARRLGLAQPSVSQTIAELERRTGTALFDRTVRPLGLTPAGSLLRQRADALLVEARQIGPLLRQASRGRVPLLRVGMVESLTRTLTDVLAAFLVEAAEQSSILSGLTAAHTMSLTMRHLDLFLGVDEDADRQGFEWHLLAEENHVLLCRAGTPAPESPADLGALASLSPLLRFSARSRSGIEIERHLRRIGLDLPRTLEFDTPYGLAAAVAGGLGFAITTPLCVAEAALPQAGLVCHPLPGPALTRRIVLVARQRELGTLPARIAALCRRTLQERAAR